MKVQAYSIHSGYIQSQQTTGVSVAPASGSLSPQRSLPKACRIYSARSHYFLEPSIKMGIGCLAFVNSASSSSSFSSQSQSQSPLPLPPNPQSVPRIPQSDQS